METKAHDNSESTQWIISKIHDFCNKYRTRLAGSASTRAATDEMAAMAGKWSDTVEKEQFTLHPTAFMGSITVQVVFGLLAIILWWISQWLLASGQEQGLLIGTRLAVFLILVLWFTSWWGEYWTYHRIFDRFHPKAEGQNVIATLKSSGETRRRIIIAGHADAAYEMRFLLHFPTWLVALLIVVADGGLMLFLVSSLLGAFDITNAAYNQAISYVIIPVACSLVAWLFFVNWKVVSPGANDNLTGCFVALSLLREMAEKGTRLQHTDYCVLITDGEESGLRGSMAFAERHKKELLDTDTLVVAADTFHEAEQLMVYGRGINFTQQNSPEVCELLHQAGRNCGYDLPDAGFYPGATDAEAFSRNGIKAAALCGNPHSTGRYYHSRYDAPDSLSPKCIQAATDILREFLKIADET